VRFRRKRADTAAVEEAMEKVAREDTPPNRSELLGLLLRAELFAPMPEGPEVEETRVAGEGEDLSLILLGSPDEPVLPLFTSIERMLEWEPEGCGYVAAKGRDTFEMAAMNGIARIDVNPASLTHGSIERHEIEALARGHLPTTRGEVVPEGTVLRIGTPAEKPAEEALEAIRGAILEEEHAIRAWLFVVQEEPRPPELTVAVEFGGDPGERESALDRIAQRAGDRSLAARELTFVPFDGPFRKLGARNLGEIVFERERG
jgi:hypothetical protein